MAPYEPFFKNKRVTVLGLGLLGRSVGDAGFLARMGARVTMTDTKSEEELKESVERLKEYPDITFHLGGHHSADFTDANMVIKAAGVRLDSSEIAVARSAGVPVYMSTALFAKFAAEMGVVIIGVTGTRGKSTVAHMIHHVLVSAGKRAHLGGNIRGVSTLAMLPEMRGGDIAVLELDSWQLQGFGDLAISPHIAVMTNLMPDHLNYYPDMEAYFNDKANIFIHQKEGDHLFVGASVSHRIHDARPPVAARTPMPLREDWQLKVPGEHNRENAALAACALHALGLSEDEIRSSLESFAGVEGRLQLVRDWKGVKIYNDNNATTPDATIAALQALFTDVKNIILIMGGADKGLDTSKLVKEIRKTCKSVALLKGTGTELVSRELDAEVYASLEEAVGAALETAIEGDVILFSPAFASFGLFKNEYDRNDQFLLITRKIL
ncbi:UDP-N-acetylmuramoylalanine--D-glutamate ligase [Candidatus Kaiserbacteria bacterium RIFCSPHIGHO2_01_FULL_56_24]|uniref:UDP-N-acetylmuramoylalanine--D-glutamate ligase n=1 Tax=Candidatus Kaiserbacteria bacterium RIFCSPHIGHO2_01_FULL_56_24 TaxID=1798487 RepID=A0A1F6DC91_9BACT|nr:MAG: UDP-N-acetylmuramoylalanine--D-glutamate ligase [Candidatus Kaiserbacteria bacterium RIFCSPHIGHO2_01_FULL_56_24]